MANSDQPCTSQIEQMPEELLLGILSKVKCQDLAQLKQVSFRLKRLIQLHSPRLHRATIQHLSIRMVYTTPQMLGQLQPPIPANCAKQFIIEINRKRQPKHQSTTIHNSTPLFLRNLSQILWSLEIGHSLNFEGLEMSREILVEFNKFSTNLRNVKSINLTLCNFLSNKRIGEETAKEFGKLLSRCSIKGLQLLVEFCNGSEHLLTDEIFEKIRTLVSLKLQLRASNRGGVLPFLSDLTLEHWSRQLPSRLHLGTIQTGFTLKGVLQLIQALKESFIRNKKLTKNIDWELGTISTKWDEKQFQQFCGPPSSLKSSSSSSSTHALPPFRVHRCSNCPKCPLKLCFEGDLDLLTAQIEDTVLIYNNDHISSPISKKTSGVCIGNGYTTSLFKNNFYECKISFLMNNLDVG